MKARSTQPAHSLQIAAVCYRRKHRAIEFLLVRTSSGRWTFPKGRNEPRLSYAEVAALEAFEEGGVQGRVAPWPVGTYLHRKESLSSKDVTVVAYLLEVRRAALPCESHRAPRWFTPRDARRRLGKGRSGKYGVSIDRVLDSALREIRRCSFHES